MPGQHVVTERCEMPTEKGPQEASFTHRLVKVVYDFCVQTSIHGLGQVAQHTITLAKFMWFLAFCGAQAGLFVHVSSLIGLYMDRPIQENTKLVVKPVRFPEVTICNLNPISPSNFYSTIQDGNSTLASFMNRIKSMRDENILSETEFLDLQTAKHLARNIGERESRMIGHQLPDMILRCKYKGQTCNITSQFSWIKNAVYFNCYTFDPGADGEAFIATGPETGLSMLFYLEETNGSNLQVPYTKGWNAGNSGGMKVMIHGERLYPEPDIEGVEIMPGHSTSITYQVRQVQEMSRPFGDCIENRTLWGFKEYSYSVMPCLSTCLQKHMLDVCECKSIYQPIPDKYKDDIYCGTLLGEDDTEALKTHHRQRECSRNVWLNFSNNQDMRGDCGCASPCSRLLYSYATSESCWPAPKYYNSFLSTEILARADRKNLKVYQQLGDAINNSLRNSTDYEFIEENFARLNVYLQDMEMTELRQQAAYPMSNLFSDVGGSLGLWVGLSVLTLVEFVQLIVRLMLVMCGKRQVD